ncbi:MAG: NHLP family bacteriocin export ABC transporter peptidase/permease/ATPase subunit [Verrucomicrobiota bacterium]
MPEPEATAETKAPPEKRRVRTPTVLQMEAVECGAAALAIVLAHYGRIVPLEELRVACGVSRDGSKASNVIKAAREYGLTAKGFTKEPDELKSLSLPCIVFWNFNHFLVVEGFGKGMVYLNDPASGPRKVPSEEFDQSFTGVVLSLAPRPDFQKGGQKRSLIAALQSRLAGSEVALAFVVLAGLALVIPGLVIPTFSKIFVDDFLIGGKTSWIGPLLLGMGLTALLRAALVWVQHFYLMRFEAKLAVTTSSNFFWHVLHLPIEFFTQRYGGEIGSRVQINDWVASLLTGQLATNMISLVMVIFYAILLFTYDVLLTSVGIFIAVFNVVALRFVSRRRVDANRRLQQDEGKLTGTSMGGLQMIETLKATGTEPDFFLRWSGYQSKVVNTQQQLAVYNEYLGAVPSVLSAINTAVILAVGGARVIDGTMTIGQLVAFQSLMASFTDPFNTLVNLGSTLQDAEGAMNRLDDVLRYKRDPQVDPSQDGNVAADGAVKLSGSLELKEVSFGYSKLDPPLIEKFSLTLKPGQRVALVGGSGSGKSTVSKLVCGLYQTWSGEILFDGQRRPDIPRQTLTNSLALVDQDIFLFEGTVRDNLTLWDETIPDSRVMQAAKDAAIHEDVAARPGGYDSLVSEGGGNYSGGQRQRLEIARALIGNPTILVLDEATSALDAITEKQIDDNLRRRGCTCLIVAHRLSTIRDCDEIIVLERGQVVQRGTHDQLKSMEGHYAELINSE